MKTHYINNIPEMWDNEYLITYLDGEPWCEECIEEEEIDMEEYHAPIKHIKPDVVEDEAIECCFCGDEIWAPPSLANVTLAAHKTRFVLYVCLDPVVEYCELCDEKCIVTLHDTTMSVRITCPNGEGVSGHTDEYVGLKQWISLALGEIAIISLHGEHTIWTATDIGIAQIDKERLLSDAQKAIFGEQPMKQ